MDFVKLKLKLFIRLFLFVLGFWLIIFSFIENDVKNKNKIMWNVVFILDVSNSMNVEDCYYNYHLVSRLTCAKKIIENNLDVINQQVWIVLFSDKFNYFIPPTLDYRNLKLYLETINTNNLDWWKTNFVESLNKIKKVVNKNDIIVLISDFDTKENLKNVKLDLSYLIWIGKKIQGVVKNKDGKKLFLNGSLIKSSLNEKKIKDLWKNYIIVNNYKKWEKLDFLEEVWKYKIEKNKTDFDILAILWSVFIILAI